MASSVVRVHAQTGRDRGRGIPPSRNTSSSSSSVFPHRRNVLSVPRPIPQDTINHDHRYSIA